MTPDLLLGCIIGLGLGMFCTFCFMVLNAKVHPAITDIEVRQRLESAQKCVDLAGQHLAIARNREAKFPAKGTP